MNLESGDLGWVGLTTYVVAWDIFAPETLSGAVDRYLEHPIGKVGAIGAVAVVGAHLLNMIPEAYDPIQQLGIWVGEKLDK